MTAGSIGNILKSKVKKNFRLFVGAVILLFVAGCFSTQPQTQLGKSPAGEFLGPYTGSKAKIAVSDFELKTAGADAEVGAALKDIFITTLNNTQRFLVVTQPEADLIISIQVNEFVPEGSGGKNGVGGGGSSPGSFMGGLLGPPLSKANMQLALRIIDPTTSTIISNQDIYSQAAQSLKEKIKIPHGMVFKAGLSIYAGTPMGKVIYDCLVEAVRYTAQNTPLNYYKY